MPWLVPRLNDRGYRFIRLDEVPEVAALIGGQRRQVVLKSASGQRLAPRLQCSSKVETFCEETLHGNQEESRSCGADGLAAERPAVRLGHDPPCQGGRRQCLRVLPGGRARGGR